MEWKDVITWLLVISGWLIVHVTTLRREERKENRDTINRLIEDIRKVEHIALQFHIATQFSEENYDLLVWRLNRITSALYRPPLKFLHVPTANIINFRQKLTSNTDKSSFKTQSHNDEVIINIHEATDELIIEIEIQKYIHFSYSNL